MPAIFDENAQFVDEGGKPLVGGRIYIGDVNSDPVANPQTIYSDRELTSVLSNPQTIDANGRASNKIWVQNRYSIQVNDVNGVQVYQDLDAGLEAVGNIRLDNVSGGNTITGSANDVSAYVDNQLYVFTAAQGNTGQVTLNINGIGAKQIVRANFYPLIDGDIEANDSVAVVYNETNDHFVFLNEAPNRVPFRSVSANTTVTPSDLNGIIEVTANATLSITPISNLRPGFSFYVRARGGNAVVDPDSSTTIDGNQTAVVLDGDSMLVTFDGANFRIVTQSKVFLRGHIQGLTMSQAISGGATLRVEIGEATSDDAVLQDVSLMPLTSVLEKEIDTSWSAGNGGGALDQGTIQPNEWYDVFLIMNSATGDVDILVSRDEFVAPVVLPSGYDRKRRIGTVLTNASSEITPFLQYGDEFIWDEPPLDVSTVVANTDEQIAALTVPVSGRATYQVTAKINAVLSETNSGALKSLYVYPTAIPTAAAAPDRGQVQWNGESSTSDPRAASELMVLADFGGNVAYRINNAGATVDIRTLGYIDTRGRF